MTGVDPRAVLLYVPVTRKVILKVRKNAHLLGTTPRLVTRGVIQFPPLPRFLDSCNSCNIPDKQKGDSFTCLPCFTIYLNP